MIRKINHIGIAVNNCDEQRGWYSDVLGLKEIGSEILPDQGVKVLIFAVGDTRIELLEPLDDASPIARFIARRGQGLHHIAYDADSCEAALKKAVDAGYTALDSEPRAGAQGTSVAFLHPAATFGVLTELVEEGERTMHF